MRKWENDTEYVNIVNDILTNNDFKELEKFKHHGDNRLNHSIRVSYYSYLTAKKFNLSTKAIARAGLLHDYFKVNNQAITLGERIKVLFIHPRIAVENSKKQFEISKLEENIILSHMFPLYFVLPRSIESIIVNVVDDLASFYERYFTIKDSIVNKLNSVFRKNKINKHVKVNN